MAEMNLKYQLDMDTFLRALSNKAGEVHRELENALSDCSALLANRAQWNSPVDTGLMVRSIEDREAPYAAGTDKEGLIREVHVDCDYAGYVEYGHNQPPENVGWFSRSVDETKPDFERIMEDAVAKVSQ